MIWKRISIFRAITSLATTAILAMVFHLGASQPASAGGGQCPAFSAAMIDNVFTDWARISGYDPVVDFDDSNTCIDIPSGPNIRLNAFIDSSNVFQVTVSADDFNSVYEAFCEVLNDGERILGLGFCTFGARIDLSIPERHICRAEILRSYTWRQLCAASAPASQN